MNQYSTDTTENRIPTLDEELLEISALHSKSSPLAMFLTLGIVANLLYEYSVSYEWLIWLSSAVALLLSRYLIFNHLFPRVDLSLKNRVEISLLISVVHGCIHACSLMFFSEMNEIERALLSLILAGYCLQATSTGGDTRQFLCFSIPIMPTIAILWTTGGTWTMQSLDATLLGVSIAMFYVQQIFIARSNTQKAQASNEARRTLAELNDQLQQALTDADVANRAKMRFLASASHDLRQPIHALSLFSAALTRQPLPDNVKQLAEHMDQSVTVLSSQLDSLLDLSKLDAGVIHPEITHMNLGQMLERIARDEQKAAEQQGLTLEFEAGKSCSVCADPLLLERVIRNLLSNAIRYTVNGGIRIHSNPEGSFCHLHISDTGPGIPIEEQSKIFDEFYQIQQESSHTRQGLGLGLSIVARLLKLMDIDFEMHSTPGAGTEFVLAIPLSQVTSGVDTGATLQALAQVDLNDRKILVVDDDPAIRDSMANWLETYGASVTVAASGKAAKKLFEQQSPDLVITDLGIGDENGLDIIQEMKLEFGDFQAMLITGDTDIAQLQRARESNLSLLHKPVSPEELSLHLSRFFNLEVTE